MKYEIVHIYPNVKSYSSYYKNEQTMRDIIIRLSEIGMTVIKEIQYKDKIIVVMCSEGAGCTFIN